MLVYATAIVFTSVRLLCFLFLNSFYPKATMLLTKRNDLGTPDDSHGIGGFFFAFDDSPGN